MSSDRPRLVYLMPVASGGHLRERITRWPTMHRTLTALATTDAVETIGLCASDMYEAPVSLDGVRYEPRRARSAIGWAVELRRLKPDVVHVNGIGFSRLTLCVRVAVGRSVRIVVQHHGEPESSIRLPWLRRLADRAVDVYLFTGGAAQAAPFVRSGLVGKPIFDVLEGSSDLEPIEREQARRRCGVAGRPMVLWVGRDTPGKDLDSTLAAFDLVRRSLPDASLYLLQTEPLSAARLEGLGAGVVPVARVPASQLAAWYSAADCLVSTSRHEGSGYSVIEALVCGCPVVLSDLPSFRSIAGTDVGARLVAVGDTAAAATAVIDVCRASRPREAVRAAFVQRLGWDSIAAGLLAAYGCTRTTAIEGAMST